MVDFNKLLNKHRKQNMTTLEDRNEEPAEIVAVGADGDTSWLQKYTGEGDTSHEGMSQYRIVPRLAITQGQSKKGNLKRLREEHGVGAVVLPHTAVLIAGKGETFRVVPLFFYTEFIQWRDRDDKTGNETVEKTFDPTHIIAKKARDKKRRLEEYAGGAPDKPWKFRFQEHLNFICYLYDGDYKGEMLVISFARGEFFTGTQFTNAIGMRRAGGNQAPTWTTVWDFRTSERQGEKGDWYGFDIRSCTECPWIKPDEAEAFEAEHKDLRKDYKEKRLIADHGEGNTDDTEATAEDLEDEEV